MAKAMQKYFHENFNGAETTNIYPTQSFPVYSIHTSESIYHFPSYVQHVLAS